MKGFVEKALEMVDVEKMTREVMSTLVIKDLDLYFVVDTQPDCEGYDLVGMTYSQSAAKKLRDEEKKHLYAPKILRLDMGKLITIVEKMGGTEEVA